MKKYQLGEFEEIVILTIGVLYDEAYGVSIKNEIETRLSRRVSMGLSFQDPALRVYKPPLPVTCRNTRMRLPPRNFPIRSSE